MVIQFIVFLLGLVVLFFGAEWLVKAASSIALKFGIRPLIIGLTIVALGTSLPEFLLNVFALIYNEDDMAVGNIVGSNIANIGLVLGLSIVLMPIAVNRDVLKTEYPMMLVVSLLFYGLAADGILSRADGALLTLGLLAFLVYVVMNSKVAGAPSPDDNGGPPRNQGDNEAHDSAEDVSLTTDDLDSSRPKRIMYLVAGSLGLTVGARLMVSSAVNLAEMLHVEPVFIGLTIVAIGTSLPELAAALVLARKSQSDMSLGNIFGSNMLNILFVVGIVSFVQPIAVPADAITYHLPVMIAFTVALYPLARYGEIMTDSAGFALLTAFVAYMGWLVFPYL